MDMGLGILLASLASPLLGSILGGGKAQTKNWLSPSIGAQDPYMLNSLYKRGLQYGIGDQSMFKEMQQMIADNWPQMMAYYGNKGGARAPHASPFA
jgi:hypothetical protein